MNKLAILGTVGILALSASGMGGMASAHGFAGQNDVLIRQAGESAVYLWQGGNLHWIENGSMFGAMGVSWSQVRVVQSLPAPIGQNVQLVRVMGTNAVYQVSAGVCHWIPSGAIFNANGFHWHDVVAVDYLPGAVGANVGYPTTPPTPVSTNYATAGWSIPTNAALVFQVNLPTNYTWTSAPDPYHSVGAVWNADGGQAQVALSLDSTPLTSFETPAGENILASGGNSGALVSIWTGIGGRIHGSELVSMGTPEYGWDGVSGDPSHDRTFLLNVTLPDTASCEAVVESMLANWTLMDTDTGAIDSQGQAGLPGWPANPLLNSNASAMPNWLRAARD